jgi:hypothetical protein
VAAFDQAGKQIKGVASDIKYVLAGIGASIVGLAGKFVDMAGNAQEVRSKFNTLFRGMEDDARKWAVNFGNAVGRSTEEIQTHMSGLQDVFVPLGYARDDAMNLSKAVTQLAVDVASFSNAADADVIRDFTSAMVGNHETVRKYGIIISEARLEQEAYEQGLGKTYRQLSDLEKATLRFRIIQESSADAMGDAVRTADSYANQTKRLKANIAELGVELGDRLLPAASRALRGLNAWFQDNRSAINRWANDFEEGIGIVTDAMDRLHEKAFKQSSLRTMFEGFGPRTQESILRAYESQTGQTFGYKDVVVPGMMGGWAGKVWQDPTDPEYARRLIESYARQQRKRMQQETANMPQTAPAGEGASALDVRTLLASAGKADVGVWRRLGDAMLWPGEQLVRLNERLATYSEQAKKADAITAGYVDDLRFEARLIGMTAEQQEKALVVRQAQQEAISGGTVLLREHVRAIETEIDALQRAEEAQRRQQAIRDAAEIAGSYRGRLRSDRSLIGLTPEEQDKALLVEQARGEAIARNTALTDEQVRALEREIDLLHRAERMQAVGDEIGMGFARGFQEATMHARNLTDVLGYLGDAATNVLDRVMQIMIWDPMAQGISGAFTRRFSPSAMGNAFADGRLQAFGLGDIVDRPTFFGFSNGIGVMGEAGTEAIMPLRRHPSGRLGVEATVPAAPPSVSIQVNNTSQAQVDVAKPDIRFDGKRLLVSMHVQDKRNYGPISRSNRQR